MSNVTRTPPQNTSVKSAFLNASSLGATELIPAKPGMSIRVISLAVVGTIATGVKFQSATNDISPLFPIGANGGLVLPFNEHGWVNDFTQPNILRINYGRNISSGRRDSASP